MIKQKGGSIVFFGSAHMDYGQEDRTAYALTKGTLYTLSTHSLEKALYDKFKEGVAEFQMNLSFLSLLSSICERGGYVRH